MSCLVWGKAIAKLTQEYEDTPLQEKLSIMAGIYSSFYHYHYHNYYFIFIN